MRYRAFDNFQDFTFVKFAIIKKKTNAKAKIIAKSQQCIDGHCHRIGHQIYKKCILRRMDIPVNIGLNVAW